MKVILYMAITANGMIAKNNNEVEWSKDEENSYFSKVREIGNIITGAKTFPLYEDSNFSDMGDPFVVVLTGNKSKKDSNKIKYVNSPIMALDILEKNGFKTALVTGGSKTDAAFLEEKLIDEIFLDVEPFVYGDGIPLFFPNDTDLKLELVESTYLNKNTIQLHYKVIK